MTERKEFYNLPGEKAQVLADAQQDDIQPATSGEKYKDEMQPLANWITSRLNDWREHRDSNYMPLWDEYERLWRMIFSLAEKQRKSERSRIVTPALSEAVENCVAEVEEAVFGRGDFFDFKPNARDNPTAAMALAQNKQTLKEDLEQIEFSQNVSEAVIMAAVYGTGIGEIITEATREFDIEVVTDPMTGAETMAPTDKEVIRSKLRSVSPRNFLIDPNARGINDGLGCAVEEYVGTHIISDGQRSGAFRDVEIQPESGDSDLTPDPQVTTEYTADKTHVYRYYGLVPRHLLNPTPKVVETVDGEMPIEQAAGLDAEEQSDDPIDSEMIEAVVVIANKSACIKAVENPYWMKDRAAVAYQWDVVPGRFWGRGVCEKGATTQKMLDAEMRSRMDALAFASAPMMAMDAARLPRGFKMEVFPGKSILTNGDPNQVLRPIKFGEVDQNTYQQAAALDQMVQRATGSLDAVAMAQRGAGGDARAGAVSMSLSGIVKRHKRTLMRFIDSFFVPALRKIMWRNMQFQPDRYIPANTTFVASSTTGIMQREYETTQLVQLLNTMQPQSREYKMILMAIIANTGLSNREQLIEALGVSVQQDAQAMQQQMDQQTAMAADPMQQQLAQVNIQLEIARKQAEIAALNARAGLDQAKTRSELLEPQFRSMEAATKGIYQVQEDQQAAEFNRRMVVAEHMLEQEKLQLAREDSASNERIAAMQTHGALEEARMNQEKVPVPVPVPVPARPMPRRF